MPDPSFQLQILIGRSASGDKTAFAALYRETSAKLFAVALRITDRKEVAEEVLQESFVAIWQRAGEYDPQRGSAMSWLGTIVRHNAIDHLRRRGSRPEGRPAPVELLDALAAGDASDRGASLRALQRCLGELEELKPENKATLTKVLTYHVVAERYNMASLDKSIKATPGGRVSLKTVAGEPLIVSESGNMLMVTDAKGGTATVTIPNVYQSNGVIMVIN